MAKRVFELARELGVPSKTVLEKCRAEGLEIKNHMSALSAGLAATISEWFSESGAGTAVETTEHVDLEAAHKKAAAQRRRRRKKTAAMEQAPSEEQPEPVAETTPIVAADVEPVEVETAPPVEEIEEVEPAVAEVGDVESPAEQEQQVDEAPKVVPNKPARPEVVKPAGPQVVPRPAKLQGPRVVRFDGVDTGVSSARTGPARRGKRPAKADMTEAEAPAPPGRKKGGQPTVGEDKAKRSKRRSPRRKGGRVAEPTEGLREWRDRDLMERSARLAAATGGTLRRHRATARPGRAETKPSLRTGGQVEIAEPITVKSLSAATGIKISDIIRRLLGEGITATINQTLDHEAAVLIAAESGIELKVKVARTAEDLLDEEFSKRQSVQQNPRAPVVTFLGHVDHGKTSLLDHIRHAAVADGEEGGITQHIGSYRYDVAGKQVVFLDTPGHEAFTAMRARGANMTDIVVLVVAADDGVMPQTVEAINHAKAANVPIVVALNKIDLPNANVQRALGQLAEHDLQPREWGGQTEVIHTSAITGDGIDKLLEILVLEAELLELQADSTAPATGWVIESRRDPARGVLAGLLVRDGTMKTGDVVLCGHAYGRVRNILDDRGNPIEQAGPATPVEIFGLDEVPDAGDRFYVVSDTSRAREVADERRQKQRAESLAAAPKTTLENLFDHIEDDESAEMRLVVKADVQGSLEALIGSLERLELDQVKLTILHSGVGGITEGDVLLAEASDAIVLGFRVATDSRSRSLAEQKGVEIRTYRVIYHLIEEIEQALRGMLAPEMVEQVTGRVEVREVFETSRLGTVAGCYVNDGLINRNATIRLIRDGVVVTDERQLSSLRRFKDDIREVRAGMECGLRISDFDDVKVGDMIEAYRMVEVAPEVSANRPPVGIR